MSTIKVTLEDVGKWFPWWILSDGETNYYKPLATELPRDLLKRAEKSSEHAKAILEVARELEPEIVDEITKTGRITKEEYDFFIAII